MGKGETEQAVIAGPREEGSTAGVTGAHLLEEMDQLALADLERHEWNQYETIEEDQRCQQQSRCPALPAAREQVSRATKPRGGDHGEGEQCRRVVARLMPREKGKR